MGEPLIPECVGLQRGNTHQACTSRSVGRGQVAWFDRRITRPATQRKPMASSLPIRYIQRMKPRVYVETSVFSYLTARESSSLVGATRQLLTRRWWELRDRYELFVSEVVLRE